MERTGLILLAAALVVTAGAINSEVADYEVNFVQCQDGTLCPDKTTCCQMGAQHYACCPYQSAQCCSDQIHCCPLGYKCDSANGTCLHALHQQPLFAVKVLEPVTTFPRKNRHRSVKVGLVPCPGGTYCENGQTCCLMGSGQYGCCPYAEAVCCSDLTSCCPEGYTCRVSTHQCILASGNHTAAMLSKVNTISLAPMEAPLKSEEVGNVRCPDGNYCLDGQTCCLLTSGSYGCCPYQHAQCCSDHSSCCPEGYRCKVSTHQCLHATTNHSLPMLRKVDPVVRASEPPSQTEVGNVRCPDGNYCLDGQTCCLLTSGRYGCCPYQHAECCSDHTSCCPEGYQCKISTHQCLHAITNHSLPMLRKVDPIVRVSEVASRTVGNVRCPDGNYCLDGQTCCLLTSGRYGCCPYQHAQCCSDHSSCCPEGYRCKVSTHQCLHATTNHSVPMLRKVDPIVRDSKLSTPEGTELLAGNVRCPDGNYCLDGQTCCLLTSGSYGCCPYQHAQCCSDHSSCCPEGYRCKISTHQCLHAITNHSVPMLRKVDPIVRNSEWVEDVRDEVGNVRCPDGNYCLDGQTCCLLTSGRYGCCPYQHAECCSDHTSCCPEGYQCKISTHQCLHAITNHSLPMLRKVHPIVRNSEQVQEVGDEVGNVRCPDGNYCLDGQTCCLLTSGSYGCCPYQHAQCCSDHSSCCPEGYQCKVSTHQCLHAITNHSLPMLRKVDPVVRNVQQVEEVRDEVGNIRCPDGNYCLDGQTCCLLSSGRYGCCPYQYAQCCSDHTSCCPEGYQCKVSTHQCLHAITNHSVPMLRKVAPIVRITGKVVPEDNEVGNVRCPDGNYCNDGQTCCLLTSGSYGCCPYQHAECCSDHMSCCPEGYMCKISTHQCIHATTNHSLPMVRKVDPIIRNSKLVAPEDDEPSVGNVRCPDGNYCLDGQTCCLSTSGRYGCCPYEYAQCCSDHVSCCPEGYQCRISTHQCIHAATNHSLPMLRKVSPIVRSAEQLVTAKDVTCADGHKCLEGQTCCQLASGKYGCCPLPDAVCCEDHKSCCPEGYVCHVATQTCQFGDHSVPMFRKVPALAVEAPAANDICLDGSECDDNQTCCQLPDGSYGCCLYNHAVCCDDKIHCCPQGYKCDMQHGQCINTEGLVQPAMVKVAARRRSAHSAYRSPQLVGKKQQEQQSSSIVCPGKRTTCPDSAKCCLWHDKLNWFCCPYANGTCCSNGTFCCPAGFHCFVPTQSCIPYGQQVPSLDDDTQLRPERRLHDSSGKASPSLERSCPDNSTCPDSMTCCPSGHVFSCCPYSDADCCPDGEHCCPKGFQCDAEKQACVHRRGRLGEAPMLTKLRP